MKLYTTVKALKEKNACYDDKQWEDFMTKMNLTSETQSFDITSGLEVVGIKDCVWALCTQKGKDIAGFNADIASLVLPIYQKKYPSDKRIKRCISLTYKYAVSLCSKENLRKAAAYDATADTAYATYADAAYAAYDAYDDAAYAAAAAYAATADAAYTVAADAADAAYTYDTGDAYKEMWNKIEQLFIEYFSE